MKFRTTVATAVAATAAVLAVGAAPANAATAVAKPTSLTLKASTNHARYGQSVELTAHLGTTASNRTVEIDNGSSVLKKGRVDAHGNLAVWVKSASNTTYVAKFAGDSRDRAAKASTYVTSAAVVKGWLNAGYKNDQGWQLYHVGQKITFNGTVAPRKATLTVHLQGYWNNTWHTLTIDPKLVKDPTNASGYTWFGWPNGITTANVAARVSFTFDGDSRNAAASSGWSYFAVTK
ncbi:hypothetical protein [Streptacidiphilus neutrinimicus]|uniref:hypothetical protein n=1 Tax=Streptacidiphilus neutrinimicus TaxID=105420 RepID=UPI0005A955C3|nr:hypothetical protein [Streptacidiphilus neutrinimicus]